MSKIPAERIVPGIGAQRVNAYHPVTGEYSHQVSYYGTEEQARARAEMKFLHPSDARWKELNALLRRT